MFTNVTSVFYKVVCLGFTIFVMYYFQYESFLLLKKKKKFSAEKKIFISTVNYPFVVLSIKYSPLYH